MGISQIGYLYDTFFFSSFPAIFLLALYFRRLSTPIRVLVFYLIASVIMELVSTYFINVYNDSLFNIQCNYWPQTSIFFYTLYFYYALRAGKLNLFITGLGISCIVGLTAYIALFSNFTTDNSPVTFTVSNLFLLIGVLAQFYQFIRSIAEYQLAQHPLFYVNGGLFFYATTVILAQTGTTLLVMNEEDQTVGRFLWDLSLVGWIIFNIFLLYAITIEIRQWDPSLPSSS